MKELTHNIRNACRILGGLMRHLEKDEERLVVKREIKRIEDALLQYRIREGYNHDDKSHGKGN